MAEYKKHAGSSSTQADFELSVQVCFISAASATVCLLRIILLLHQPLSDLVVFVSRLRCVLGPICISAPQLRPCESAKP